MEQASHQYENLHVNTKFMSAPPLRPISTFEYAKVNFEFTDEKRRSFPTEDAEARESLQPRVTGSSGDQHLGC
jgi:hypothetical protein